MCIGVFNSCTCVQSHPPNTLMHAKLNDIYRQGELAACYEVCIGIDLTLL